MKRNYTALFLAAVSSAQLSSCCFFQSHRDHREWAYEGEADSIIRGTVLGEYYNPQAPYRFERYGFRISNNQFPYRSSLSFFVEGDDTEITTLERQIEPGQQVAIDGFDYDDIVERHGPRSFYVDADDITICGSEE